MTEICRRFTGLVKKTAGQNHLRTIREDALAEGWLAVVKAVNSYDPARDVPFPGYVESRVRYAVWNLFKRERRRWEREPLLNESAAENRSDNLLTALAAPDDVQQAVEKRWQQQMLQQALVKLPLRQRRAVERTLLEGERLNLLAAELGVTVQAVHNLRKKGLGGLKKELAGMYLSEGR